MNNSFIIFAGGTGGHVLPAVSFGNYLIENGFKCLLITDIRGKKYLKLFKGKIKVINASHLSGNFYFKFIALLKLFIGFVESFFIILSSKPRFAISFGSYASLPPCLVIKFLKNILKINFFIHEQNSVIGRSNKFFIQNSSKFFVNFNKNYKIKQKYKSKIQIVGLPKLNNNSNTNTDLIFKMTSKFNIFIYGGSQGSIKINKFFEKLLNRLNDFNLKKFFFVIQAPSIYFDELILNIKKYQIEYELRDFYFDLQPLLKNTDLIISRSGAGTINDIISNKIPSIQIPLPSAKDNHQYENAKFLVEKKCAILINQDNIDIEKAYNFIIKIYEDEKLKRNIKNKLNQETILDTNRIMLDSIKYEIHK